MVGDRLQLFRVVKAHKTAILAMVADPQVLTVCLLYWYKSAITDAAGGGPAGAVSLLALLVQKYNY